MAALSAPRGAWEPKVLAGVGARPTPSNLKALAAWHQAEGGSATNNPFNTTQPSQGAKPYNTLASGGHVWNYTTPQSGIKATIDTLNNGHYANIIASLRKGTDASAVANAVGASPWGTSGSLMASILGKPYNPTKSEGAVSTAPTGASVASGSTLSDPTNHARQAFMNYALANSNALIGHGGYKPEASLANLFKGLSNTHMEAGPAGSTLGKATAKMYNLPASLEGQKIVNTARTQLGQPYQWGGEAKLGSHTDCSGLVQAVLGANGIRVPRTTYDQWHSGKAVSPDQMQPGDVLFFHMGNKGPEHVGIYQGNGKMIEDPHTGDVVKVQSLASYDKPVGVRRFSA